MLFLLHATDIGESPLYHINKLSKVQWSHILFLIYLPDSMSRDQLQPRQVDEQHEHLESPVWLHLLQYNLNWGSQCEHYALKEVV